MTALKKPEGFEADLGSYGPVLFDGDHVIAWGYPIVRYLKADRFEHLRTIADVDCVRAGVWVVVSKRLTHREAIKQYGKETSREVGPQGGWRSVTYGTTRFRTKLPGCPHPKS
jgi:hypothetical protein